jgi:hypothetical protein
METVFGVFVIIVGLICWIGQSVSFFFPDLAVRLGVLEPKDEMDDTFHLIDSKVLGLIDIALTWILPLSSIMMLLQIPYWPIFALIGSGIYIYFSGFVVFSRLFLSKAGKKVGSPSSQITGYVASFLWFIASLGMTYLSFIEIYRM